MAMNGSDARAIKAGSESGPKAGMRFWTTDWSAASLHNWLRGRPVFIVCSGPSLATLDLSLLSKRGIVTLGVNNSWLVHRPTLWTCVDSPDRFADVCWKDPGIVKFVPAAHRDSKLRVLRPGKKERSSRFRVRDMPSVWLYQRADAFDHRTFATADSVQWGCSGKVTDSIGINGKRSVMQAALSLACGLGSKRIYLLGADFRMAPDARYAFDEGRSEGSIRHNNVLYRSMNERFTALKPELDKLGIRVWNCTEGSGLTAFPHMPYEEAVAKESADCSQAVPTRGWYERDKETKQ